MTTHPSSLPASERFPSSRHLVFRDLGRMSYAEALAVQRSLHEGVVADRDRVPDAPMPVLFVEHDPPVITVSRRPGADAHLLASPELLAAEGIEVAETDRGGDITYHGPGQLVVYPILDLNRLSLRIHGYMRLLEDVVTRTLAPFGIEGHRDVCATGVWVGGATQMPEPDGAGGSDVCALPKSGRKICALGVRVSRWVSMHGLALNVTTNLAHFGLIVPCGLAGRPVTSMAAELGAATPSMNVVRWSLARELAHAVEAAIAGRGPES
jgi:lipoyl(octanoyl) transferase